ncbi:L-serine ammonia-lyase, iron-sulfur-dependent, subunit alpha, partial [Thermodesulfobacteriota bacterium]
NLTEELAGVICDGAKAGCALKLSIAGGAAVHAALFSLKGVSVMPTDGIIGVSPEQTVRNIGELAKEGMIETDRTILNIIPTCVCNKFANSLSWAFLKGVEGKSPVISPGALPSGAI